MTQIDLLAEACSRHPGINLEVLAQDGGLLAAHEGQASLGLLSGSLSGPLSEEAAISREEMTGLQFTPGKFC